MGLAAAESLRLGLGMRVSSAAKHTRYPMALKATQLFPKALCGSVTTARSRSPRRFEMQV